MLNSIIRIDDRLIHGQVIVGWGSFLNPDLIIVGNDEIANVEIEQELCRSIMPPTIEIKFMTLEETARALLMEQFETRRYILLIESPDDALKILNKGVKLKSINIGGIHFKSGAEQYLTYVYLNKSEKACLKEILKKGVELECRDLPQSKKIFLKELLKNNSKD